MEYSKFLCLILALSLLTFACSSDDTVEPEPGPTACKLTDVDLKLDETTWLGLFSIEYDENNRMASAGLQTYNYTYDTAGKLIEAKLPESEFNPEVTFVYSYDGDKLSEIKQIWGTEPNLEERYVFTVFYDANGYVDKMNSVGFGGTLESELDYDFDSNGNALIWTEPVFVDRREYTFSGEKGLLEPLDHTLAFAYGVSICQPFFHFYNTVTSEKVYDSSSGALDKNSTFSKIEYNELGFQTLAEDPAAESYRFEYECK